MFSSDVIVIGGGLVGTAVAYGLGQLGKNITVLDEGDDVFRASRLLVNAIESMNGIPPDERLIEIATGAQGRSKVGIEIRDCGPGGPIELSQRIVEPYFSTKGSGIGMGLMISRTIVESHGGCLQLLTGRAQRTCFRFTLPVDQKAQR